MPVLSENKCVSMRFELSIRCIEAERERFPKEYICTKMLNATAPLPQQYSTYLGQLARISV